MRPAAGPSVERLCPIRPHPHRLRGGPGGRRGGGPGGLCRRHHPAGGGPHPNPHHPPGPGGLLGGRQGGHRPARGEEPGRDLLPAPAGAHGPGGAGHPPPRDFCRRHGGGHQVRLHRRPGLFGVFKPEPLPLRHHGKHRTGAVHLLPHQGGGGGGGRAGHRAADDPQLRPHPGPRL